MRCAEDRNLVWEQCSLNRGSQLRHTRALDDVNSGRKSAVHVQREGHNPAHQQRDASRQTTKNCNEGARQQPSMSSVAVTLLQPNKNWTRKRVLNRVPSPSCAYACPPSNVEKNQAGAPDPGLATREEEQASSDTRLIRRQHPLKFDTHIARTERLTAVVNAQIPETNSAEHAARGVVCSRAGLGGRGRGVGRLEAREEVGGDLARVGADSRGVQRAHCAARCRKDRADHCV